MKKILYSLMSVAVISLFACGDGHEGHEGNHEHSSEDEASVESHEGHDHAEMEETAKEVEFIPAPDDARVFFVNLKDGDFVTSPLKVEFGVEGMSVHPAGEALEGTGHHHIILEGPPVPVGMVVPADDHHIHFGGGQTETEIELMPGPYTLTLQFADGLHRSYGEPMSASILVEVAPAE